MNLLSILSLAFHYRLQQPELGSHRFTAQSFCCFNYFPKLVIITTSKSCEHKGPRTLSAHWSSQSLCA